MLQALLLCISETATVVIYPRPYKDCRHAQGEGSACYRYALLAFTHARR